MNPRILLIASWRSVLIQDATKILSRENYQVVTAQTLEQGLNGLCSSVFQVVVVVESSDMISIPKEYELAKVPLQVTPLLLINADSGSFFRNYVHSILDQNMNSETDAATIAEMIR